MTLLADRGRWSAVVALLFALVSPSCERTEPSALHPADAPRSARIVSLSPGVTATLVELGAADLLVGCTPWCVAPSDVPAVGTLLDIDAEALVRANPSLVFVQPPAQGIPSVLVELAQRKRWTVVPIPLSTLADCRRAITDVAAVCGSVCPVERREQLQVEAARLGAELDAATAPINGAAGTRVLAVLCGEESADLLAFGTDSYLMESLRAQGFAAALDRAGYQSLGQEDLLRVHPDIMLLFGRGGTDARFDALADGGMKVLRLNEPALLHPGGGITESLVRVRSLLAAEVNEP